MPGDFRTSVSTPQPHHLNRFAAATMAGQKERKPRKELPAAVTSSEQLKT